jgi:hypothetical protein
MNNSFTATGTLTDGSTVTLDAPVPLKAGRVRVTVEPLPPADPLNLIDFFDQLERDQAARGHVPMTREEIDAFMREERAAWNDRP